MEAYPLAYRRSRAFTLIELSIVLVIMGLIVGGMLVGQDLVRAAAIRAQVSQIEKLHSAVNTFRGKYNNYLPGDIPDPHATNFGLVPRGSLQGQGDGNSIIEGIITNVSAYPIGMVPSGENLVFWVDLSNARLIDNSFTVATSTSAPPGIPGTINLTSSPTKIRDLWPDAKIGSNNFINVYSYNDINYFNLGMLRYLNQSAVGGQVGLTVNQAYAIDKKMDDGFPASGKTIAQYQNGSACGANNGPCLSFTSVAIAPALTTCFDNNSIATAIAQYSIAQNNGTGLNCALSFKFQ